MNKVIRGRKDWREGIQNEENCYMIYEYMKINFTITYNNNALKTKRYIMP